MKVLDVRPPTAAAPAARRALPAQRPPASAAPARRRPKRKKPSFVRQLIGLAVVIVSGLGVAQWASQMRPGDQVSSSERAAREVAYTNLRDMPLPWVTPRELDGALEQMLVEQDERTALRNRLTTTATEQEKGKVVLSSRSARVTRLARIMLWDTHNVDRDVIAVISAGYRQEVELAGTRQSLVVPVDDSFIVQIVGVRDGGGGDITLGVGGLKQEVLMPVMAEGQILSLPIAE